MTDDIICSSAWVHGETRAWSRLPGHGRPCATLTLYSISSETVVPWGTNKGEPPSEIKISMPSHTEEGDPAFETHGGEKKKKQKTDRAASTTTSRCNLKSKREHVGTGWRLLLWCAICYWLWAVRAISCQWKCQSQSAEYNNFYDILFSSQDFRHYNNPPPRPCIWGGVWYASIRCSPHSKRLLNSAQGKNRDVFFDSGGSWLHSKPRHASHWELNNFYRVAGSDVCPKEVSPAESKGPLPLGPCVPLWPATFVQRCLWPFIQPPHMSLSEWPLCPSGHRGDGGQNGRCEAAEFMADQFPERLRS